MSDLIGHVFPYLAMWAVIIPFILFLNKLNERKDK